MKYECIRGLIAAAKVFLREGQIYDIKAITLSERSVENKEITPRRVVMVRKHESKAYTELP